MNHHSKMCRGVALAGALFLLAPVVAWAQAANNVDCNKCVDKGDIAKKAVKKKNLAKGAIDSSRIADGAVKAKDIAASAVEGSKLAAGSVSNSKIADGAVTMAKLAPNVVFQRIIVVRADPTDTIGNCDALLAGLAGITDNDADNRYLIHLEPGIYDCGNTSVQMKPFVDLQGSGRGTTLVTGSIGNGEGVVAGADNTELRRLTVENKDASSVVAVIADGVASFRITDVVAIGRNADFSSAVLVNSGNVELSNVMVGASNINNLGRGINVLNDSNVQLVNVTAGDEDGLLVPDFGLELATGTGQVAVATARNSLLRGNRAAASISAGDTGSFISTQLDGGTDGAGTFACVDSYNGNYAVLLPDCN